jgi:hypothetical protein
VARCGAAAGHPASLFGQFRPSAREGAAEMGHSLTPSPSFSCTLF